MTASPRIVVRPALGEWRDAWDALVSSAPLPTPFLRSWWLEAVSRRSQFVLVVDGERLIGGLALEVAGRFPVRRVQVGGGGTLTPDHLDLVAASDTRDVVVVALRAWWTHQHGVAADLRGIRDGADLLEVVAPASVEAEDVAPYEPVVSYEEWLERRSGSFRKRLRRLERHAARAGVVLRGVEDDEVAGVLDAFAAFHAAREDRAQLSREIPRLRRAVEAGHRAGEVVLAVAEADGRYGWVGIALVAGRRLCLYQSARSGDPIFDGLGTLLDRELIRLGLDRGVTEVDFLRGAEAYKASFVAEERALLRIRAGRGPVAEASLRLVRAAGSLRRGIGAVSTFVRRRMDHRRS
ncbi:MAG: GNAT family N-acetyltransferase [Marmoricola sp.]